MKDETAQRWADRFVKGLCYFVLLEAVVILAGEIAEAVQRLLR